MEEQHMDEQDDTSSNPLADQHLPVAGEVTPEDGNRNPDISDNMEV